MANKKQQSKDMNQTTSKRREIKQFDVKVEITVRVMPRAYYENMGEELVWKGMENRVNFDAKILGKSLEDYYHDKISLMANENPELLTTNKQ